MFVAAFVAFAITDIKILTCNTKERVNQYANVTNVCYGKQWQGYLTKTRYVLEHIDGFDGTVVVVDSDNLINIGQLKRLQPVNDILVSTEPLCWIGRFCTRAEVLKYYGSTWRQGRFVNAGAYIANTEALRPFLRAVLNLCDEKITCDDQHGFTIAMSKYPVRLDVNRNVFDTFVYDTNCRIGKGTCVHDGVIETPCNLPAEQYQIDSECNVHILGRTVPVFVHGNGRGKKCWQSWYKRQRACLNEITSTPSIVQRRLGVALLGCRRLKYMERTVKALATQTHGGEHVTVYIDNCGVTKAMKMLITRNLPSAIVTSFKTNLGIARMTVLAQKVGFRKYDRMLFVEEDQVLAQNYLHNIGIMLEIAANHEQIGVVNGAYKDLSHGKCDVIVQPHASGKGMNMHDVWAWATTREKWKRYFAKFLIMFKESNLHSVTYQHRDASRIARVMQRHHCPIHIMTWKGQDWLRLCAMHISGMPFKLTTVKRMMTYIGDVGMHSSRGSLVSKGFPQTQPNRFFFNAKNLTVCKKPH